MKYSRTFKTRFEKYHDGLDVWVVCNYSRTKELKKVSKMLFSKGIMSKSILTSDTGVNTIKRSKDRFVLDQDSKVVLITSKGYVTCEEVV